MTAKKKQNRKSFRDIIKYNFDNLLMRGAGAQILLLIVMTGMMAVVFGLILSVTTSEGGSAGSSIWTALVHSLDPGVLSGSDGSAWFLFLLLQFVGPCMRYRRLTNNLHFQLYLFQVLSRQKILQCQQISRLIDNT